MQKPSKDYSLSIDHSFDLPTLTPALTLPNTITSVLIIIEKDTAPNVITPSAEVQKHQNSRRANAAVFSGEWGAGPCCTRAIFPLCIFTSSSFMRICVQLFHFNENTGQMGLGPALMTSFELDHFCKDPIFKQDHILNYFSASTYV